MMAQYIPRPGEGPKDLVGLGGVFQSINLNNYSYAGNRPTRFKDPTGGAVETPWDVLNVVVGAGSLGVNLAAGNWWGAAGDAAGLIYDLAATAVPGLPAGAGAVRNGPKLIKAAREMSEQLAKGIDNAPGPVRGVLKELKQKLDDGIDAAVKQMSGKVDDAAGGAGRGGTKLRPDSAADGPHSTFKRNADGEVSGHAEWTPNSRNPSGFDQAKRVDTQYAHPHTDRGVPTPHVHEKSAPGGVRPALPDDLPK